MAASEFDYQLPPGEPRRPQPQPTGKGAPILPLVLADLQRRSEQGAKKYGTPLRAHNGRDALRDAVEEAYDQVMYLRQLQAEWPRMVADIRATALGEAIQLGEELLCSAPQDQELQATAAFANGLLRRFMSELRGLQSGVPATPKQSRPKTHRWRVLPGESRRMWRCADCPLERWGEVGPLGGPIYVFGVGGEVVARGAPNIVRVPVCTGTREDR